MNRWKKLLALLRGDYDYKGTDSVAEVEAFVKTLGDSAPKIADKEGKTAILDGAMVKSIEEACRPRRQVIDLGDGDDDQPQTLAAKRAAAARPGNPNAGDEPKATGVKAFGIAKLASARKAYNAKAAHGATQCTDADGAEIATAYLRLKIAGANRYGQREDDEVIVKAAMGEGVNSAGGAYVDPQFLNSFVIWRSERWGVARRIATTIPMSSDVAYLKRNTSLPSMSFQTENPTSAASGVTYGTDNVVLTAKKAIGLLYYSRELFEDAAINVADQITKQFVEAELKLEDQCFVAGDGTSTYGGMQGLISALKTNAYISGAGNAWSALTLANLETIMGSVENVSGEECAFLLSRQAYYQIVKRLVDAGGGNTNQTLEYGPAMGMGGQGDGSAPDARILGWPAYFSQACPTASASGISSIYFGAFKTSFLGLRRSMEIIPSDQAAFTTDQIVVRATDRFAVNHANDGRTDGNSIGTIVALKTT